MSLPLQKKRGRPPKYPKNSSSITKKNVFTKKDLENGKIIKKRRGRPPKCLKDKLLNTTQNIVNVEHKKKRGRPPKNKIIIEEFEDEEYEEDDENEEDEEEDEFEDEEDEDESEEPAKKRCKISKSKSKSKSEFKSYSNNENKSCTNKIFVTEVIKTRRNRYSYNDEYFVGALDSGGLNTCKCLIGCGIKSENILLVERKKEVNIKHKKKGFNSYYGTLKKYSEDYSEDNEIYWNKICYGWYFDTCGTIKTQGEGILQIIKRLNLTNGSSLGFTFCLRGVKSINYHDEYECFRDTVVNILRKKGFGYERVYFCDYCGDKYGKRARGSSMFTFFIKVI